MSDLIDRQAAIDALIERDPNCGIYSAEVIKKLPSAQSEIIHCRDCKYWERNYYQDVETCFEHRNVDGTEQATPPEYYCGSAERREE